MSWRVEAMARPEVAAGFAFAGLHTREVTGPGEAAEWVRQAGQRSDVGVLLLEDTLYEQLPEDLLRVLGRRPLPMLVPFPGPHWEARPEEAEAYVVELLRRVVGYRVRLK
ncbi:MAG TPA: V-type ATP synthase subunit F [Gemmatimonadales bacterium]|nr:V-type ATP synthase subunit F [Gemmatimonadales bacterium]